MYPLPCIAVSLHLYLSIHACDECFRLFVSVYLRVYLSQNSPIHGQRDIPSHNGPTDYFTIICVAPLLKQIQPHSLM